eukprot:5864790-Amphidinium_carterae.1
MLKSCGLASRGSLLQNFWGRCCQIHSNLGSSSCSRRSDRRFWRLAMFILQPFVVSILLAAVAGMTQNETLLGETRVEEAGSMDELLWPDLTSLVGPLLRGTSLISKFGTDYTSSDAPQRELQDV